MSNVRVVYYGNNQNKKIADFIVNKDDILELVSTVDYQIPCKSKELYDKVIFETNNQKPISTKKGFGEVVASFTKLFGFKTCAPCNKRRQYLNKITPMWISNILSKFYK